MTPFFLTVTAVYTISETDGNRNAAAWGSNGSAVPVPADTIADHLFSGWPKGGSTGLVGGDEDRLII